MEGLVELARQNLGKEELAKQEVARGQGDFTLLDFKKLIGQTRKLGPIQRIIGMIPGMGGISQGLAEVDSDKDLRRITGIIDAMTPDERRNPRDVIDESRRSRVAKGAGVGPGEVLALVRQFEPMADMMKKLSSMGLRDRMRLMRDFGQRPKTGGGERLTPEERARLRKLREDEDNA